MNARVVLHIHASASHHITSHHITSHHTHTNLTSRSDINIMHLHLGWGSAPHVWWMCGWLSMHLSLPMPQAACLSNSHVSNADVRHTNTCIPQLAETLTLS